MLSSRLVTSSAAHPRKRGHLNVQADAATRAAFYGVNMQMSGNIRQTNSFIPRRSISINSKLNEPSLLDQRLTVGVDDENVVTSWRQLPIFVDFSDKCINFK